MYDEFSQHKLSLGNLTPLIDATNESIRESEEVIDDTAITELMERIEMRSAYLKMSQVDDSLIRELRETIVYQRNMSKKREQLVFAITSNIQYLAQLHKKTTQKHNGIRDENTRLWQQNFAFKEEV